MRVVRTFHPVGQGAFYSERFYEKGKPETFANVVYDCGVAFGHVWQEKHVVSQAFSSNDEIEILFISHLDYDHVSLIETLFNQVKGVKNLVLPFAYQEQLMIAMTYYRLSWNDYMVNFLQKIIKHLNRNHGDDFKDGEYNIIFVGDLDKDAPDIGHATLWKSGTPKATKKEPEWVFIPYNVGYRWRKQEFITELGNLLKKKKFSDEILKVGEKAFQNADELYEKLKDTTFVEKVLFNTVLRAALKDAYKKIEGGTNENSLLLYSGPISKKLRYTVEMCVPCRYCGCCGYYKAGCLYTGDSTLDIPNWRNAVYKDVWDCIGTIQVPHHGSIESFDMTVDPIDKQYIMPVSIGSYNTYGHPSGEVLAYILNKGCCTQIVSERADSVYMQVVEKW